MISILINIIKIIFLLGLVIGIHETGHFLIAKLCKVKVNEFAIGFGPTIWKKQGKETKYALRLIPLGGFVNMEGEEESSDKEGSFSKASVPKRIAIVAAGALVNIIFAIILYFGLSTTQINHSSNIVKGLEENFAAQSQGIEPGDKILKINGRSVVCEKDIQNILEKNQDKEVTILIQRNEKKIEIKLNPTGVNYKSTGIYLQSLNYMSTKIVAIENNSAANIQGFKTGDTILEIDGEEVKDNPQRVLDIFKENKQNYNIKIERANKELIIQLTPEEKTMYYLGVKLETPENNFANKIYYAGYQTKEFLFSIIDNLKELFTGRVQANQLMGPVGISEVVVKTNGIKEFIYILAMISISLGFTNLMPFPPLDGGKILFLIIEAIRRKPLKQETEIKIQMLGFAALIVLSIFITYNDISRIF